VAQAGPGWPRFRPKSNCCSNGSRRGVIVIGRSCGELVHFGQSRWTRLDEATRVTDDKRCGLGTACS
jgi:hypothetical protein